MIHGIAHESSVSFVAVLLAIRALRKGFDSASVLLRHRLAELPRDARLPDRGGAELFPGHAQR